MKKLSAEIKSKLKVPIIMDKAFKNIDRALSKNATLNMAICIFLIVYLAFDIKDYIPGFLNNELVRLVVIVVAVYLILRCNMNKISASSHACTAGILLLLAAVLHNHSEGFFGRREGFETYTKKDGEKTYVVDVAQAQATEEATLAATGGPKPDDGSNDITVMDAVENSTTVTVNDASTINSGDIVSGGDIAEGTTVVDVDVNTLTLSGPVSLDDEQVLTFTAPEIDTTSGSGTGGGAQQQSGQQKVVGIQEGEYASL